MILFADGGSTKCDWRLLDTSGTLILSTRTEGLNPAILSEHQLLAILQDSIELSSYRSNITELYFYGAGCGTPKPTQLLENVFRSFFVNIEKMLVKEDMLAAVYAVTETPGIVCILGTGSNSCYFDGKRMHTPIASLGYILMDEASGNYFGKQVLRDYYYKRMPIALVIDFEKHFDLAADTIKENLYKKEHPNAYLASFAAFLFTSQPHEYIDIVLRKGIQEFIENRVLCFENAKEVPIHFVGSIAHFSEVMIKEVAQEYQLTIGNIVRRPIDGVIERYRKRMKMN